MLSIPLSNTSSIEAVPASKLCFTEQHRALIEEVAQEFDPAKLSSVPRPPEGHKELLEALVAGERRVLRSELAMKLLEILVLPVVAEYGLEPGEYNGNPLSIRQWLVLPPSLDAFAEFYDEDGLIPKGSPAHLWISDDVSGRQIATFEKDAWDNINRAVETFEQRLGAST